MNDEQAKQFLESLERLNGADVETHTSLDLLSQMLRMAGLTGLSQQVAEGLHSHRQCRAVHAAMSTWSRHYDAGEFASVHAWADNGFTGERK